MLPEGVEVFCKPFERPSVFVGSLQRWTKLRDSASSCAEVYYRPSDESIYMLSMEDAGAKRYHVPTLVAKLAANEVYRAEVYREGRFAHLKLDARGDAVWLLGADGTVWRNEQHRRVAGAPNVCLSGLRIVKRCVLLLLHEDVEEAVVSGVVLLSASLSMLKRFRFESRIKNATCLSIPGCLQLLLLDTEKGLAAHFFRGRKLHRQPLKLE